jgi:hypothetical protein
VIDGDFCEDYGKLDHAKQERIAEEMGLTRSDLICKLEEIKNKIL